MRGFSQDKIVEYAKSKKLFVFDDETVSAIQDALVLARSQVTTDQRKKQIENISQEIGIQLQGQALRREQLADLVHQVWVNWMVCVLRITGSPDYRQSEQPARWGKQMTTKYRKLPADQKEYDRNIADAILLKLKGVNHEF